MDDQLHGVTPQTIITTLAEEIEEDISDSTDAPTVNLLMVYQLNRDIPTLIFTYGDGRWFKVRAQYITEEEFNFIRTNHTGEWQPEYDWTEDQNRS